MKKDILNGNDTKLEQTVVQAWQGVPELKIDEKRKYLGTFAERVLNFLTEDDCQSDLNTILPKIKMAMEHNEAKLILIRSDYVDKLSVYLKYAHKIKLKFRTVSRPDIASDIVLVVSSDHAIKN